MENGRVEHGQTKNIDFEKGKRLDILWARKEIFPFCFSEVRAFRRAGQYSSWAFLWNILAIKSTFSILSHLSPFSGGHHAVHIRYPTDPCP